MLTRIIKIGNSHGVRIPKPVLEQTGLTDEVEMAIINGKIVIQSVQSARQNWEEAFVKMAKIGDDQLIDSTPTSSSQWDEEEWEW
ncbi:MAG: antitoxin MazE [Candidatus Latescibacterota bacterium]|jgi:antitoxin MazE